jgi:hypothetical protein
MKFFKKNRKSHNKQFLVDFLNDIKLKIDKDKLDNAEMQHLLTFWLQSQFKEDELDKEKIHYFALLGWYVDQHITQ